MSLQFDVLIVGGGAAGMMAAISVKRHHPDFKVAIIDRTFALGRKILVCGAGRCNVTNLNLNSSITDHYYGASPEFISSIFQQFGYEEIVNFFNDLGVELYVERKTTIGKLFPVTDQAKTITALLEDELERLEVKIILNTEVQAVNWQQGRWKIKTTTVKRELGQGVSAVFDSRYLILSAGGQTYPALGANGSGYKLAESLGHSLVQPVPSALPLEAKSPWAHFLQGTKLELEVTTIIDQQTVKTRIDDVMFTKYGLSGPAILNVSREVSLHFNREHKNNAYIQLNFFPAKTQAEVATLLAERWQKRPDQLLERSLYGLFPNKIAAVLLKVIGLEPTKKVKHLAAAEQTKLVTALTATKIKINATRGWNEAEFTAGGINTTEVQAQTLASKLQPNLYLAGEILDVDGDVGGFNLSWSWASGFVAGKLN